LEYAGQGFRIGGSGAGRGALAEAEANAALAALELGGGGVDACTDDARAAPFFESASFDVREHAASERANKSSRCNEVAPTN
jgi:hypothetical protein